MGVNVITGAKAIIKIQQEGGESKIAGYATGISISEVTFNGRVDSLGFIDTREIVPIGRNVSATVNFIRVFDVADGNTGYDSISDTDADETLVVNSASANNADQARTDEVLGGKPFSLFIYDSHHGEVAANADNPEANDKKMYELRGCRISSQNIVVDRGSMMGVQCTIDATHLVRLPNPNA